MVPPESEPPEVRLLGELLPTAHDSSARGGGGGGGSSTALTAAGTPVKAEEGSGGGSSGAAAPAATAWPARLWLRALQVVEWRLQVEEGRGVVGGGPAVAPADRGVRVWVRTVGGAWYLLKKPCAARRPP